MALGTLGDLRTEALGPRTDMVSRFPAFVALAEQRIYYGEEDVPPLRVRPMEQTSDLAFVDGVADLPEGYLDKRALYWEGVYTASLSYEPPGVFYPMEYCRRSGPMPMAYTIEGDEAKIAPALTGTGKLLHYAKQTTLAGAADNVTNAILTGWPGVYLFGTQIELYRATRNDSEMVKAMQAYRGAVNAANRQTMNSRAIGGTMRRRVGFGV